MRDTRGPNETNPAQEDSGQTNWQASRRDAREQKIAKKWFAGVTAALALSGLALAGCTSTTAAPAAASSTAKTAPKPKAVPQDDHSRAVAACKAVLAFNTGPTGSLDSSPDIEKAVAPLEAASNMATDGSPLSTDILAYYNALVWSGDSAYNGKRSTQVQDDCLATTGIQVWPNS